MESNKVFLPNLPTQKFLAFAQPCEISFFTNIPSQKIIKFCQNNVCSRYKKEHIRDYYLDKDNNLLHSQNCSLRIRNFLNNQVSRSEFHIISVSWDKIPAIDSSDHSKVIREDYVHVQGNQGDAKTNMRDIIKKYEQQKGFRNSYQLTKTKYIFEIIPMTDDKKMKKEMLKENSNYQPNWEFKNMGLKILVDDLEQGFFGFKTVVEIEFNKQYLKKAQRHKKLFLSEYGSLLRNKLFHKIDYLTNKKLKVF